MKCFKYKLYKGKTLVLTNWINSQTKEEAIQKLELLREEYKGTSIKVMEV